MPGMGGGTGGAGGPGGFGGGSGATFAWSQTGPAIPSLTNPGGQSSAEGDTVALQVQASDPNGAALSYAALNLPPGVTINQSSGLISGTVSYTAAEDFGGTYNSTVIVSNGQGGSNNASFAWSVSDTPRAPQWTNPGGQSAAAGDTISLQIQTTRSDGDQVSYDAVGLPPGLSISPDTGLISGSIDPSAFSATPYQITVTATTAQGMATAQSFAWSVGLHNHPPVLTNPGDQSNATGDSVSLQLTATDADNDNLTWTASGLPTGLGIDPGSGAITGVLDTSAAQATPYSV
jgi:hypothetical protein